jgi:superfamily I DNA/RNA helicase
VSFLEKLNPQQREAVETIEGPLLILAGAGSGKTRVITFRIAHLIENLGAAPESILAVTFTNKAAGQMAERVEELVGGRSFAKPWISTFHSMCVRMLRRDVESLRINNTGYTKDFAIYDESDQQQVVKGALRRLGVDDKQLTPRTVLSKISWAKNHMLDPQEAYLNSGDEKAEKIAQIYEIYRQELRKANAMDFDDLLLEAVRLLKVAEPVRHYYNRRFHYLLVDEYQDTNRPQYELMRLLSGERHNVCAVGDEDQSIYSWRGADIRNILEFERDFPNAKIIRLEQNYRSTQNILTAASSVVANNIHRKGKKLWTSRQGGPKLGYYEAPDGENESLFVADTIAKYLQSAAEQGEKGRAAVLYRTNAQSRLFEEAMRRYQMAYHVVGGFSFYERAEIKDMISYLKVVQNPADTIGLLRVINTPARGIGKTTVETLERIALETGTSLWGAVGHAVENGLLPARAVAALKNFREVIEGGRAMLGGTYLEWLGDAPDESQSEAEERSDPSADANATSFGFGWSSERDRSPTNKQNEIKAHKQQGDSTKQVETESAARIARLQKRYEELQEQVARIRTSGWRLVGILHHKDGTVAHDMFGEKIPDNFRSLGPNCEHCNVSRRRNDTFVLCSESGDLKQIGRTCLQKFLPDLNPEAYERLSDTIKKLQAALACEPEPEQAVEHENAVTAEPGFDAVDDEFAAAELGRYLNQQRVTSREAVDADEGAHERRSDLQREATTAELLKFLLDRTGYIKALEAEDTPEAYARIENLKELVNAAMDSRDRGESLQEFLDHAALVSDADQYDAASQVTLMTLHSAKGLEFPLVFLAGMEEGLFPHSRTFLNPEEIEEERRLCYVGMTRAMDQLVVTRARFRRRYGTDMPEPTVASRFLEEVPPELIEDLGSPRQPSRTAPRDESGSSHYDYENEDQRPQYGRQQKQTYAGHAYNSIDNIAEFFASRGKKFPRPKIDLPETTGKKGFKPGQRVRHPKYGEGTVYQREGEGENAKLTVKFSSGLKKLVEKYAQLEKV